MTTPSGSSSTTKDAELLDPQAERDRLTARIAELGANLQRRALGLVASAAITIVDVTSLQAAVKFRDEVDGLDSEAETYFKPEKKFYYDLHKAACARENAVRHPLAALKQKINDAIRTFNERAQLAKQEEERRLAVEQQQRLLEQATHEAEAFEDQGQLEMAALIRHEAETAPLPVVALPDVVDQVEGLSFVRTWRWRYVNGPNDRDQTPPAVLARAKQIMARDLLMPDEAKITALVKVGKDTFRSPGIEVYYTDDPR